jgi:cytochrome c oxidase cbb3-type subunit 3
MLADSAQAREAGHTLFVKMTCAGCHTYTGKGWMGPDLTDSYWRFGGAPEDIYRSIYEGRPQGMPAWGKALSPNEIWQLVLYIRTLPATPGGDAGTVSPLTQTAVSVDTLPPTPDSGAAK